MSLLQYSLYHWSVFVRVLLSGVVLCFSALYFAFCSQSNWFGGQIDFRFLEVSSEHYVLA
jgi:hypothetical protein